MDARQQLTLKRWGVLLIVALLAVAFALYMVALTGEKGGGESKSATNIEPNDTVQSQKTVQFAHNYLIGEDSFKTSLSMIEVGELQGLQSFCIYDEKYYSTDGENLFEQDSGFELVSTTPLKLGHGNALQLGSDGKAYASGWNDGNIYVVDLESKTIEDVIALPVEGYTTCAVDDVNKIVYIFHRTTHPGSGNESYNFITYDYANDSVVDTRQTATAFGAMQACDFIDGMIFVVYGLGSESIPNGYQIYNTSGDVVSEYVLESFASQEPEGIAVDRGNHDVYISFVSKRIYKMQLNV